MDEGERKKEEHGVKTKGGAVEQVLLLPQVRFEVNGDGSNGTFYLQTSEEVVCLWGCLREGDFGNTGWREVFVKSSCKCEERQPK